MKRSAEELEKIKKSSQKKDPQDIVSESKNIKNEDQNFASNLKNEDNQGDQNFISNLAQNQNSNTSSKKESVYKKFKDDLGIAIKKLQNAIRPVNIEIRSLDNEVGGIEVDYKKIQKQNNQDIDVWDDRVQKIKKATIEANDQDMEENESFIHAIKTGMFSGKKRKKRRTIEQVDLGKAAEEGLHKSSGYVKRLVKLKEDRSHNNGGIGI